MTTPAHTDQERDLLSEVRQIRKLLDNMWYVLFIGVVIPLWLGPCIIGAILLARL